MKVRERFVKRPTIFQGDAQIVPTVAVIGFQLQNAPGPPQSSPELLLSLCAMLRLLWASK